MRRRNGKWTPRFFAILPVYFVALLTAISLNAQTYTCKTIAYPGANGTDANGINNNGQVVGAYIDAAGTAHGYVYDGTSFTSFDYPYGGTCISPDSGFNVCATRASAINDSGQIVGYYTTVGTLNGFMDNNGTFTTISDPGATYTVATGINNAGTIVGYDSHLTPNGVYGGIAYGFVYDSTGLHDIPYSGSTIVTNFNGINQNGEIIGWEEIPDTQTGFLYSGGTFTTLPVINPYGLNKYDQVVGLNSLSQNVLVTNGTSIPINCTGATSTVARGINDKGQIVGTYFDSSLQAHAFLGSPAASPTISTTNLPNATATQPYSQALTATGGTPPYTWSIISEPTTLGLVIDATSGTISGTLATAGTFTITVQVQDSLGATATADLTIVVLCDLGLPSSVIAFPYGPISYDNMPETMRASFFPISQGASITLTEAQTACGFTGFNWQQVATRFPYFYLKYPGFTVPPNQFDPPIPPAPFYYTLQELSSHISPDDRSLDFYDSPENSTIAVLNGAYSDYMAFETRLVGLTPSSPTGQILARWTWTSTYNPWNLDRGGTKCTDQTGICVQAATSSQGNLVGGSGGVTLTSINGVPIATFSVFLNKLQASSRNFQLVSSFTLGSISDGIKPLTETMVLMVGSYSITIPPNSFQQTSKGYYVFQGTINGESLQLQLSRLTATTYALKAEGSGATPISLGSPPLIVLKIGNDLGVGPATVSN